MLGSLWSTCEGAQYIVAAHGDIGNHDDGTAPHVKSTPREFSNPCGEKGEDLEQRCMGSFHPVTRQGIHGTPMDID